MSIEQVKEEAKKQFDKELTGEQAQALLEKGGELTDEVLGAVAGGAGISQPVKDATKLNVSDRNRIRQTMQNRK